MGKAPSGFHTNPTTNDQPSSSDDSSSLFSSLSLSNTTTDELSVSLQQQQQQQQQQQASASSQSTQSTQTTPMTRRGDDDVWGPPEIEPHELEYHEKIGGGCFGNVYRGYCRGREVAIKKLFRQSVDEKTLSAFRKEIMIMSALRHPEILLMLGACFVPGHLAVVTEYVKNGDLQCLLHDESRELSLYVRLKMARDSAVAMNWLHCSNPQIIHRDIKPSNILVDEKLHIKLCDFGLAAVKMHGEMLQDKGSIPGTPLWMAPEVLMGRPLDEKSDVHSFAIVLWEVITQEEPFPHMTSYTAFRRAICRFDERPPIPADCDPDLVNLLKDMWHKDPKQRPSFADVIDRLEVALVNAAIADTLGRQFWLQHFRKKEVVLYDDLATELATFLKLPPPPMNEMNFKCLKAMVATKSEDSTLREPPDVVHIENFGNLLGWFGPLESSLEGFTILDRIRILLRRPWFHGDVSKDDTESLLSKCQPGTFLVRLSTTRRGCFTISKVNQSRKINHQRIDYRPGKGFFIRMSTKSGMKLVEEKAGLETLIAKLWNDLHLEHPCPGSKYTQLFSLPPNVEGYLVEDDLEFDS